MELPAEGSGLRGKDEVGLEAEDGGDAMQADGPETDMAEEEAAAVASNPLQPPPARKLCIRHQRMADEGTVGKLQRVSMQRLYLPPSPTTIAAASRRLRRLPPSSICWRERSSGGSPLDDDSLLQEQYPVQFEALMISSLNLVP